MKRSIVVLFIFLLLLLIGCQSKAQLDNTRIDSSNDIPTLWCESFDIDRSGLTIKVDAKINGINKERFPIYEIAATPFTETDIELIINSISPNAQICPYQIDKNGNNIPIKAVLEEEICTQMDEISLFSEIEDDELQDAQSKSEMMDFLNQELTELQELYSSAVDAEYSDDYSTLLDSPELLEAAVFNSENEYIGCLNIINGLYGDVRENMVSMNIPYKHLMEPSAAFPTSTRSIQDSILTAEDLLQKIHVDDFTLNRVDYSPEYDRCSLYYTRQVNGFPYSSAFESTPLADMDGSQLKLLFEMYWHDEYIRIDTGDYGICFFEWVSKSHIMNLRREEVLLPFSTIQKLFRRYIEYVGSYYKSFYGNEKGSITVTGLDLGYKRVPIKDRAGKYEVVPVWSFEGYYDSSKLNNTMKDSTVILVINAIDGSLIG